MGVYGNTSEAAQTSNLLSLSVIPNVWSLGTVMPGTTKTMTSLEDLTVQNDGTLTGTLSLQISDPGTGWTPGTEQGVETYVLRGLFCGDLDDPAPYFGNDDILGVASTLSSSTVFGDPLLSDDGASVLPCTFVRLWLQFDAPLITNRTDQQNITVTIGIQPD